MRTELRFLLAVGLMFVVLIGTNMLFPPVVPEGENLADSTATAPVEASTDTAATDTAAGGGDGGGEVTPTVPTAPGTTAGAANVAPPDAAGPTDAAARDRRVVVEGPLYRYEFSTLGARLMSAELPQFQSLAHDGVVDLVPEGVDGYLDQRLVVGSDTVDLRRVGYSVEPEDGLTLTEGGGTQTLSFVYQHPTADFRFTMEYTFDPELYVVSVNGSVSGVDRPFLMTNLGDGLAFAEADSAQEARMMAYVRNHVGEGIQSTILSRAEPELVEGPLVWAAFKSKFFVLAMLAGESEETVTEAEYLRGLVVSESALPERIHLEAVQSVGSDGEFSYRLLMGPQVYSRLAALGQDMEEVNPYGWRFLRPIVRPFVSIITTILSFLHNTLNIGYGWVLIVFSLAMRIVLFPLNHKAMKANLRNMAVQPLVADVQKRYKDNPEKLQKEMVRLYKEHGFNPLAGCLPMLLPWPILVSLFFVFQNTIGLRAVPFLWLPDLSAHDPYYILPVALAISMFLMQWVGLRSLDQPNPQMKMMMYFMPVMMLFIFMRLPSGLNLYYATTNVAMIPQQVWIANERKKVRGRPPPKLSDD
ncbi:MAG: membrane protein insertase YidC [Gemmatimonadota bacterium]|jgi:YidC/Oxa1 family membrane protein insertase